MSQISNTKLAYARAGRKVFTPQQQVYHVRRGSDVSSRTAKTNYVPSKMYPISILLFSPNKSNLESRHDCPQKPNSSSVLPNQQFQDDILQILYERYLKKDSGQCKLGQNCTYAHEKHEKRVKNITECEFAPQQWTQQMTEPFHMYTEGTFPGYFYPETQQIYPLGAPDSSFTMTVNPLPDSSSILE